MKTTIVIQSIVLLFLAALLVVKMTGGEEGPQNLSAAPADSPTATAAPKQLWTCGMHPQVILPHPGICPICHMKLVPLKSDDDAGAAGGGKKVVAYWWDPMLGAGSITNHPGKSAMGMDLVPVYEDQVSAGPAVRIDSTVVQNMGVVTVPVVRGPLTTTVRAVGMLEAPETGLHDIALKVPGYIEKLYANTEGMSVAKGQVLFDLYSPDLQLAEQELITGRQNLQNLDANVSGLVRRDAERFLDSSKEKLRLWDVAEEDIDAIAKSAEAPKTVPFRSPADGHVVDKAIVDGSAVPAGMKLMRIEDHSSLWLDLQVHEEQISMVKIGDAVSAVVDGLPAKTFMGTISFIHPHIDHMLRVEMVRTVLDNANHELSPGMYATAQISTQSIPEAILAPREAVIDTGTQQIAFVLDPLLPGHFQPRQVRMGLVGDDDKVQIVQGLAPGDQVVTSGQFLMDVESRTTEAIEKLRNANAPMPATTPPTTPATMPAPGGEMMHSEPSTPAAQP